MEKNLSLITDVLYKIDQQSRSLLTNEIITNCSVILALSYFSLIVIEWTAVKNIIIIIRAG